MGQRDVAASQSRQQCLDSGGFQVRMLAGRPARHSASTMAAMASGSCAPSIIEAITVAATRRVRKDRGHPTGGRIEEASTIRGEAQPACPSEFVFIQCGPGVGGSLLLWRMISPWRAKHRRSEPVLTISAGRPACAGSESKATPRERESIQEAICSGGVMKKSIGQSHSIGTAPRLLTIKQVADRLTVSVGCLRAWRIRGEGPPAIRVGSALRWAEREVDAWLNARRESGGLAS